MYRLGYNRIYYQTGSFDPKDITCKFLSPEGTLSQIQNFDMYEPGIYFLDYEFKCVGDHLGIFFEGASKKTTKVFKVERPSNTTYDGIYI